MFDSQTLSTASSVTVFGPWIQRGGDYGAHTLDVTALSGTSAELVVRVFHKNLDEAGDGGDVDTSTKITINSGTSQRITVTWPVQTVTGSLLGYKQLVRYKYTFTSSGAGSVSFRMLDTIWFDNAKGYA